MNNCKTTTGNFFFFFFTSITFFLLHFVLKEEGKKMKKDVIFDKSGLHQKLHDIALLLGDIHTLSLYRVRLVFNVPRIKELF